MVKSRGQHCGDIELAGYLANVAGPVSLVLDLRIAHDRVGSSTDPTLNGHLRHPNNLDQSLNDTATDEIRKYRADYNNNPPSVVSFMPTIASTSGRSHCEFIRLLFLQAHWETDRFFAASGVQLAQSALRINLNLDGAPITSKSHTHPSHSQTSRSFTSSLSLGCSSSTTNPVYARSVNSLILVCSLSSHRHSYIGLLFNSHFIDS